MQTTIPKDELQEIGRRFRADYLAEQAGYTFGIAAAEGEDLSDLLPDGFLPTRPVFSTFKSSTARAPAKNRCRLRRKVKLRRSRTKKPRKNSPGACKY
jgi:hypothetical protein